MRPCFAAVLVALSLGLTAFNPLVSRAQEQPDGRRKIASKVVPAYPELARKMHILGTVKVEVVVARKYPPAEPGALVCEPLEAARRGR